MTNLIMVYALKRFSVMTMNFFHVPSIIPAMQFLQQVKTTLARFGDDSNGSTILRAREDAVFVLRMNDEERVSAPCR